MITIESVLPHLEVPLASEAICKYLSWFLLNYLVQDMSVQWPWFRDISVKV